MIKVNLLKNKGAAAGQSIAPATQAVSLDPGFKTGGAPPSDQLAGILKILIMCSGAACLFAVQKFSDGRSDGLLATTRIEKDRIEGLKVEKEERANKLSELQQKFDFLKSRTDEFQVETKLRLAEIESLDAVQSAITREAWLGSIVYSDGTLSIKGSSYSGEGFDEFNANLERQKIFKSVRYTQVSDSEASLGATSTIDFQLTAEVDEEKLSGR